VIIATFIEQLRANAPVFQGRVAGAAEFYKGLRDYNTSMPMPAAYVLPLAQEAGPNLLWNGLIQIIQKGVGVAVELDAQQDRRGQRPVMDLDVIEAQLFRSVLNLLLPGCNMVRGVYFTGARYLDLDRARLWYQWEFGLDWQVDDTDGVQPDSIPLETIEVDVFHAPGAVGVPGSRPAAVVVVPTGEPPYPPATNGPWPGNADAIGTTWDDMGTTWDSATPDNTPWDIGT
jgi:hypothetical protein